MDKLVLIFIGVVGLVLVVFLNYDFSSPKVHELTQKIEVKEKVSPKENTTPIQQLDVKKEFKEKLANAVNDLHVVSSTEVNGYNIAIRTLTKPQPSNSMSPPQFPTMVGGEINGEKFYLTLNEDAKKENMVLTITKNGTSAMINAASLQSVGAGQMVNIGNLTPPATLDAQNVTQFEQAAQSTITQSVNTSQNTQSTSIAPPSPPSIGK